MALIDELKDRSGDQCELCVSKDDLMMYEVKPRSIGGVDGTLLACKNCITQIDEPSELVVNHWRCLNDSMWSEFRAVKVVAWRMLNRLKNEGWPKDLLDMMYLEGEELSFAEATGDHLEESEKVIHRDSNGVVLQPGDNVVLIKDLKVKGSSMVAKQGTAVRRISLDPENQKFIEGRVGSQTIVIITDYVKKMAERED